MKITSQILQLLIETAEQADPNISYPVLKSNLGKEIANYLIDQNFLTKGHNLETYYLPNQDKEAYVEWNDSLKSFAYLSDFGRFLPIESDELKTFDINFETLINFLCDELNISLGNRNKNPKYLDGILYFMGESHIGKKKTAIFLARRINNQKHYNQIEEFFHKQSPTKLPKLILTSSNSSCPESFRNRAKIISIPKLLTHAKDNSLFNMDYIENVLLSNSGNEFKPYVHCTEDASTLFIGDKSFDIKGDKQRQIIKVMCDLYFENPDSKMRWNTLVSIADIETESRYRDMFKNSSVRNVIVNEDGLVWFKTT